MKPKVPLLALTGVFLLVALFLAGSAVQDTQAASAVVAFDMVGSTNQNLISFTDDPTIPFSDPRDGFNKFQRNVSPTIPYDVLDDSAGSYPPDRLGIIKTGNIDEFFGVLDTDNNDTGGSDVIATWVFDISTAPSPGLSIDMGAMGDFEKDDYINWSYSIDGAPAQTVFQNSVDEASSQTYTLESGSQFTLNDPMLVNGVLLNNNLQTISAPLSGPGNQLTLILTANTNGGGEAVAFQNIKIGDLPPAVKSTNPANGDIKVPVDTTIEIDFTEDVAVTDPWLEISCTRSGLVPASYAGGPQTYIITPDDVFIPGEKCTVTVVGDSVSDIDPPMDKMESDYVFSFHTALPATVCGDPAFYIHEVQGPGDISPLVDNYVVVEGVVVGDFQEYNQLRGFYIQEENADFDNQKETSEGVFVYEYNPSVDVEVGQRVRVTGQVVEYYDFTEITDVDQIQICGEAGSKEYGTVNLRLPEKFDGQLERYEGMYVTVPGKMTVAQNYFLGRYGQLTLTNGSRLYQPTNQYLPGSAKALQLADRNARSILFLDDGTTWSNLNPVPHLGPAPGIVLRAGDTVTNLVGVLEYSLINSSGGRDYRLHPTEEPEFINKNIRTESPDAVGGNLKVATMNVLNYFTTLDGSGPICGPLQDQFCRGADSASEFDRQETKIVKALAAMDADIVGLMEIENHPADVPVATLVAALNDEVGAGTYDYIATGAMGTDAIRQALIYKPANVTPLGGYAAYDDLAFVDPLNTGLDRNRPALAQTFADNGEGGIVTVAVNHLKSKSGSEYDDSGGECSTNPSNPDCDQGDGQGYFNATRTAAAQALVSWLDGNPTGSGDDDYMIIGDLNAYAMEDPIRALTAAGYFDVAGKFEGNKAYSYTFDGLLGTLDYVLASNSLNDQVRRATVWHINTDEPAVIDYDENFNPPGYYNPDPFRASDHDPVIVGLQLK